MHEDLARDDDLVAWPFHLIEQRRRLALVVQLIVLVAGNQHAHALGQVMGGGFPLLAVLGTHRQLALDA